MLKQALDDKVSADSKDMAGQKSSVAAAKEEKAVATGNLAVTEKELKSSKASLATTKKDCMNSAADHEATVAARTAEMKVIATAKKILEESSGAAASFLQVAVKSKMHTHTQL